MRKNKDGLYELFGVPYAQYIKGDVDYSRTRFLDRHNSIAWRVGVGVAYPYGNDIQIPFEKRYYSGGANSVRGWAVRTLGPGKYTPDENSTFFDQAGDIKLDLNVEYRTKFFWKLELATYIDAGNVWTIKSYDWQPGGLFQFNSFYKDIAMSYGLGLRFDFDYFLIRFDTGFKAYNPEKSGKDRWTVLQPNFRENFAWHFAVGYPF
jgi:outer membrane protein assembly factor BamA